MVLEIGESLIFLGLLFIVFNKLYPRSIELKTWILSEPLREDFLEAYLSYELVSVALVLF